MPLYYAKEREVIEFEGMKIMVDDERIPETYLKNVKKEKVRFRTLGCYPLTGAVISEADSLEKITQEVHKSMNSERSGRAIDRDQVGSMEKKKLEGYF